MKRFLLLCFLLWSSVEYFAQGNWFFGAGATRTYTGNKVGNDLYLNGVQSPPDSGVVLSSSAIGRTGIYFEFGRDYFNRPSKFISGWEWGVHVKSIREKEIFKGVSPSNDAIQVFIHEELISNYYPGAFLNLYNEKTIIDGVLYMRNNLGINADYALLSTIRTRENGLSRQQVLGNRFVGQIHYKLSFPLEFFGKQRITPSIETPILSVYSWDGGKSTLQFLNFRYRPVIFSVRIDLGSKSRNEDRKCTGIPEKRETPELWGPEMRKFKKRR